MAQTQIQTLNHASSPIVSATVSDAEQIVKVQELSWKAAYPDAAVTALLKQVAFSKRVELWQARLKKYHNHIFMASVDSQLVGFCFCYAGKQTYIELEALYVHPHFWRMGIGQQLIEHGVSQLPARQYWQLWVLHENLNAQHFYQHLGYQFDGRVTVQVLGGVSYKKLGMRKTPMFYGSE